MSRIRVEPTHIEMRISPFWLALVTDVHHTCSVPLKLQTILRTARGLRRRDVEASFQLLRLQRTTRHSSGYHDIVVSGIGVGYSWAGYSTLLCNFLFGLLTDGATRTLSSPLPCPLV